MACSNCFNGCTEIVSDQCVRYTGVNVPVLGIQTGDSLSYVEQALITFLTSTLDGTGIKIDIPTSTTICNLVQQYLPTCGDLTTVDLFNALIKATCDLQVQVTAIASAVSTIEAAYNISCLTGVTSTSGTHAILQATINNLCELNDSLTALSIDVDTNYVKNSELCDLVTACIAANNPSTGKYFERMVPYTVVEYYGSLIPNFSGGVGQGDWENIYLCNGQIVYGVATPDKRGRVGVGVTDGTMGGATMDAQVTPGGFNPNYSLYTKAGVNSITLTQGQMPAHIHTANSVVTDPGHVHTITMGGFDANVDGPDGTQLESGTDTPQVANSNTTGITVDTTISTTGGSEAHANNQPALGCYYIMYIPTP